LSPRHQLPPTAKLAPGKEAPSRTSSNVPVVAPDCRATFRALLPTDPASPARPRNGSGACPASSSWGGGQETSRRFSSPPTWGPAFEKRFTANRSLKMARRRDPRFPFCWAYREEHPSNEGARPIAALGDQPFPPGEGASCFWPKADQERRMPPKPFQRLPRPGWRRFTRPSPSSTHLPSVRWPSPE